MRGLNLVLRGWCTYFRVGNSNRVFHRVDWMARSELQLWLRRKHQCDWRKAEKRWGYGFLHERCDLYRMVGKVSHLPELRKPPEEGGRRAVCGKTNRQLRTRYRRDDMPALVASGIDLLNEAARRPCDLWGEREARRGFGDTEEMV